MEYMILHNHTVGNFLISCPSCTLAAVTSGGLRMFEGQGQKHKKGTTGRRAEQHTKSGDIFIMEERVLLQGLLTGRAT